MRLATFNFRQGGYAGHWAALLELGPDLAFAQESKDPSLLAGDLFAVAAARAVWRTVPHGRWGSALWVADGEVDPIALPGLDGWVVGGRVRLRQLELLAFSVHLPPERGSYAASAHRLLDALRDITDGAPLILAGDWNLTVSPRTAPGEPRCRTDAPAVLERLREEHELVSAWATANEGAPLPQTLRWSRNPVQPFHCDGLFVPAAWRPSVQEVRVLDGPPWLDMSDHNPVVAALDPLLLHGPQPA